MDRSRDSLISCGTYPLGIYMGIPELYYFLKLAIMMLMKAECNRSEKFRFYIV